MASKARGLADLGNVYSDGALSNRNLIINGAMQVAQRGVSFSTGNGYTLDRWRTNSASSLPSTASQEDDSTFNFGEKHLKFISNSSAAYSYVAQKIENMKQFSGKTVTLSFDYTSTQSFSSSLEYHYGVGGSSAEYDLLGVTIPAAASATRYSRTITLPDLSGKTFGPDSTSFLHVLFNCTSNPTTLKITNVQLEVGDTATAFEHRSYGDELQRCQRYYCKSFPQGITPNHTSQDCVYNSLVPYAASSFAGLGDSFPVEMRATPTVTVWTAAPSPNAATGRITFYDGTWKNTNTIVINTATSSTGYYLDGTVTTGTKLVQYNFEADAEL